MFWGTRATNFSIYATKMDGAGPKILGTGAKFKRVPRQKSCRVNRAYRVFSMLISGTATLKQGRHSFKFMSPCAHFVPFLLCRLNAPKRGVYTTEQKWHGSDKNWNGSNSFCKETLNFYPFRNGSIGAYGPDTERIKFHCFFAKNYWNRSSFCWIRAFFSLSCKHPF